jgi:Protein of unknown function DUF115
MAKESSGASDISETCGMRTMIRRRGRTALYRTLGLVQRVRTATAGRTVGRLPDTTLRAHLLQLLVPHYLKPIRIPPTNERLKNLRDRHVGERCFIVGTGPSLRLIDLSKLRHEFVFTVNKGYLLREQLGKWPEGYLMSDPQAFEDYGHEVPFDELPLVFLETSIASLPRNAEKCCVFQVWEHPRIYDGFCETDITKPLYGAHTSVLICAQIGAYMGFKTMYFLGVDLSFGNNENHFYQSSLRENARSGRHSLVHAPSMLLGFKVAREILERRRGVKMINAGVGGQLTVLPRVRFDEIF